MYMGGAFGRRSITDYTIETALIARATNRPGSRVWNVSAAKSAMSRSGT
jgi:hypothetical protein